MLLKSGGCTEPRTNGKVGGLVAVHAKPLATLACENVMRCSRIGRATMTMLRSCEVDIAIIRSQKPPW